MPKIRLTARGIEAMKPPPAGRLEYFDAVVPGFGIRVTSTGVKSFFWLYRDESGKQKRWTLGRFPALTLAKARNISKARQYAKIETKMIASLIKERDTAHEIRNTISLTNEEQQERRKQFWEAKSRCFTYIIYSKATNLVKIGKSINPEKRKMSLQTASGQELEILLITKISENELHERFYKLRMKGEWFKYDKPIKDFIIEQLKQHIQNIEQDL